MANKNIFAPMYQYIRSLFFLLPAETAHHLAMGLLKKLCSFSFIKKKIQKKFSTKASPVTLFNIAFSNPVGLAAGFDKNASYLSELQLLGFGFVEIGTVTPKPQKGNPRPRLFRLPKDMALINRMGFNNDGVQKVAESVKRWRSSHADANTGLVIGGNIGKNKSTPNEEAWKDYDICFRALHACVDFFVVNVSSPNTPGLRELQEKDSLRKILQHLQKINEEEQVQRPLLLKIAPDLTWSQVDDVIDLAIQIKLDGLVVSNTTVAREHLNTSKNIMDSIGAGGLSGRPLKSRSTELVRYIHDRSGGVLPIIASGGVFTAADAKEKIQAGASLVEVWTGFIYEGPAIAKNILQDW